MYILPQENYPVEGQSSPKCFLGALVRMRLMLVWDLDNTLVDCLEAPDTKVVPPPLFLFSLFCLWCVCVRVRVLLCLCLCSCAFVFLCVCV